MGRVILALFFLTAPLIGGEVYFLTPQNNQILVDVLASDSVQDVKLQLALTLGMESESIMMIHGGRVLTDFELMENYKGKEIYIAKMIAEKGHYRDFYAPLSAEDVKNIRFIYTTLAKTALIKLWGLESDLEKAGERIMHIHPLKILECAFSDEELKECMSIIKDRLFVWKRFSKEMGHSLQKEKNRDNLTDLEISNFASNIDIDLHLISPLIKKDQWEKFIKTLIAKVPRKKNSPNNSV